ncbi:P-loop containing nucleoside triphosphate hydrolase protein [Crassisporium funariophilum]|nr:P-loop containing nucleoside triphosphate hydrolase protein [Crassisporium funariophilum]
MDTNDPRASRLSKIFHSVLFGKETLKTHNTILFIEALYSQPDAVVCVDKIIASKTGLSAIQTAIRSDLSLRFLNRHASAILTFFQAPDLKIINGGEHLKEILLRLVEPPTFWAYFRDAFLSGSLDDSAQQSFGWLLLQLCSFSPDISTPYREHPSTPSILAMLLSSPSHPIRSMGQKLKHVLDTCMSAGYMGNGLGPGPGGRHDNDHADFRDISILPTADELKSLEPAFIRPSDVLEDPETESTRIAIHLDNQFRLLREDMLYEMRDELQIVTGVKKGYHKGVKIGGLAVRGIDCGEEGKRNKWGLVVECTGGFPQLNGKHDTKTRKAYLLEHRNFLKHQSLACLISQEEILAFPTIIRNEDMLAKDRPEIVLQFEAEESAQKALQKLRLANNVTLIQIDTAIFAYEPILSGLQQAKTLPLSSELLLWKKGESLSEVTCQATRVIDALQDDPQTDLQDLLDTPLSIKLDTSQAKSLISGLTQKVSLIQGPPGTGKSFIGALLAKALHDHTDQTILVVCYTNHALDDILTGLMDVGIPESDLLRLGGKSTTRTEPLALQNQPRGANRSREQWTIIDELKRVSETMHWQLQREFNDYMAIDVHNSKLLPYLEFEDPDFFEAFRVPFSNDGMAMVGKKGRAANPHYLIERWGRNWDAGIFANAARSPESKKIWSIPMQTRWDHLRRWEAAIFEEITRKFCATAEMYNRCQEKLARAFSTHNTTILRSKRIVGCTTTAAAKYRENIQAFNPDIMLVEEAGEILESHILTALGPETSQIILIGDHKQLRPKVNHYLLTVEKGEGYDLNRSLFERLILKDYPHETLTEQHRMRPEISALIRNLTYPELVDAPKTRNRPDLIGVQDNIVFIDHAHQEDANSQLFDRRDMASKSSKQNSYEALMILKIVKYLSQQGYGTDNLVILTPYLGQLNKLRDTLKEDNDPILNDLDSYELVRAGLVNPAQAKLTKKPLRLATIDNYQGEESDIVIVSLTRSNPNCDIGFMFSPERLNVLLSRARNALIMIGNAETFKGARKGKELWNKLFDLLGHGGHVYDGFPIVCERHPDKTAVIRDPKDFEATCPDGGCNAPCGVLLSCGIHSCPSRCHQLYDHSKMTCPEMMSSTCSGGHSQSWSCGEGPLQTCTKCERDLKLAKAQQQYDLAAKQRRDAEQQAHLKRLDQLNAQIGQQLSLQEDARLAHDRANAIKQKEDDLAVLVASKSTKHPSAPDPESLSPATSHNTTLPGPQVVPSVATQSTYHPKHGSDPGHEDNNAPSQMMASNQQLPAPIIVQGTFTGKPFQDLPESPSKQEWKRQKDFEGASNTAIDSIMEMTGLEDVKRQVLGIKAKIDTTTRQNASLKQERFNVVLLGNPGTGKTTIARHYAKFLASVKVIPHDKFVEISGSRLAHDGVNGIKTLLEGVVKAGGGTIFIDEAYQLTSGHNPEGPAVLDFLLAEMENNIGTLVFILAGYNREMEKFFDHNPGLNSRVPYRLQFADYKDEELMLILEDIVKKTFEGRMVVQEGLRGLYGRIIIRRLGRRRGQSGFGNARDLQATFAKIRERQAVRLNDERRTGARPDDFFFSAGDLIGPDPSKAILKSKAWERLQELIGLNAVKESIQSLLSLIKENYCRELLEKEPLEISLNRVFLGSPGTGKTTVAKLYGQVLLDLGLLSNGEVVLKNPSDFVGAVLGASEVNTKAILANAVGKVLIIDEAYMLYGGGGKGQPSGQADPFKTTVIDTIVAEVQSVPGEDRCVLMLGYRDQMLDMFRNVNPGLSRRFKIEDAFNFEDFNDAELLEILNLKLKDQDLDATDQAKKVAIELLGRSRNRPNFGNAGEVENIITQAKTRCMSRRARLPAFENPTDIIFEPQDFDPEYNRSANAAANLTKLFEDIVGCEDIMTTLGNYQDIARVCKTRNLDAREEIPTNFVFTGPPGTGKTTVARKLGQVFYDMGILASAEVIECSASDLVGQYVGQTGPKTKKLFEEALGKVLFIDEAYRLGDGHFAQEAVDELVGLLTQPTFKAKLIVILAGYEDDMNRLMEVNTGLSSRFPDQLVFQNMSAEHCLKVIDQGLRKKNVQLAGLDDVESKLYADMKELIRDISEMPNWGNARDMITLTKDMVGLALRKDDNSSLVIHIAASDALDLLKKMLTDRQRRSKINIKSRRVQKLPEQSFTPVPPTPPATATSHATATDNPPSEPSKRADTPSSDTSNNSRRGNGRGAGRGAMRGARGVPRGIAPRQFNRRPLQDVPQDDGHRTPLDPERDAGVSDTVWAQLKAAKRAAETSDRVARNAITTLERKVTNERNEQRDQHVMQVNLEKAAAQERDGGKRSALQREREEARLKELAARAAGERAAAELRIKKEEEQRRKEQEAKAQRKLREMGVCPAGFRWTRMGSLYRCAGGSHTVSVGDLGLS